MERLCFMMTLRQGQEDEYDRRHHEIWPEMVVALTRSGYRNYSLFRKGTTIVGYAECFPDATTVISRMAEEPVNTRWSESFSDIFESFLNSDGELDVLEELWHLEHSTEG